MKRTGTLKDYILTGPEYLRNIGFFEIIDIRQSFLGVPLSLAEVEQ